MRVHWKLFLTFMISHSYVERKTTEMLNKSLLVGRSKFVREDGSPYSLRTGPKTLFHEIVPPHRGPQ